MRVLLAVSESVPAGLASTTLCAVTVRSRANGGSVCGGTRWPGTVDRPAFRSHPLPDAGTGYTASG
jgi:hypothetical protein